MILKWYWRYGGLNADDFYETLEEAVASAAHDRESGEASPAGIEAWDADGYHYIGESELRRLIDAYDDELERNAPPPRPNVGTIEIHAPTGMTGYGGRGQAGWVNYSRYDSEEKLAADLNRLQKAIGVNRVRRP